jgi:hypothetical protein
MLLSDACGWVVPTVQMHVARHSTVDRRENRLTKAASGDPDGRSSKVMIVLPAGFKR